MLMQFMDAHPWLWIGLYLGTPILLPGIWFLVEELLFHRAKRRLSDKPDDLPLAAAVKRHKTFAAVSGCLTAVAVLTILALVILFMVAIAHM